MALDYLHLGEPTTLRFELQIRSDTAIVQVWKLMLSKKLKALNCIVGVKFWVFLKGEEGAKGKRSTAGWVKLDTTYAGETVTFSDADTKILKAALQNVNGTRFISPMFAEVSLKQPSNLQLKTNLWAGDMNCEDAWVFPVRIAVNLMPDIGPDRVSYRLRYIHTMGRPIGEQGEIPMWAWLFKTYQGKYPKAQDITGSVA